MVIQRDSMGISQDLHGIVKTIEAFMVDFMRKKNFTIHRVGQISRFHGDGRSIADCDPLAMTNSLPWYRWPI